MRFEKRFRIRIREIWRKLSGIRFPENRLAIPALLLSTILLQGCLSRKDVLAEVWLESGIPASACTPEVAKSGVYRKLNNGKYEFISYCNKNILNSVRFNGDKFYNVLNAELPDK